MLGTALRDAGIYISTPEKSDRMNGFLMMHSKFYCFLVWIDRYTPKS